MLRDGLTLAAIGIGAGLALAFGAGRLVAGQLTGVSGADPVSFAGTAALLGGGGGGVPAARAPGLGVEPPSPRCGTRTVGSRREHDGRLVRLLLRLRPHG